MQSHQLANMSSTTDSKKPDPAPIGSYASAMALNQAQETQAAETSFNLAGTVPNDLKTRAVDMNVVLVGITREEFTALHTGAQFDFGKLEEVFKQVVEDYLEPYVEDKASKSLQFCSIVAFTIGPNSRNAKKAGREAMWKMMVLNKDTGLFNCIIVSTFKGAAPKDAQPKLDAGKLVLTIKQASLLAVRILNQLVPHCVMQEQYLLTPLAGSVFCKDDLKDLANDLNWDLADLIQSINASCQSGGFYLPGANATIACVAAIVATRNAEDKLANAIITKTVKQYNNHHFEINFDDFAHFARVATGGIPVGCTPKELKEKFEKAQAIGKRDYNTGRVGDTLVSTKTRSTKGDDGKKPKDDDKGPKGSGGGSSTQETGKESTVSGN